MQLPLIEWLMPGLGSKRLEFVCDSFSNQWRRWRVWLDSTQTLL